MIALSLLTIAPGRMGGSEGYARGLARGLAAAGTLDYVALVPPDARDAAGGLTQRMAGAPARSSRALAFARAAAARRALRDATVVHYPLTVPLPPARAGTVVTLHDVLHLDRPDLVSRATRLYRRFLYDGPARRADRVVVPSSFVRERAVARLGLDPARVRVVPHGLDHDLYRPGGESREPFLLYPARPWPHKNHRRLFDAFERLRRRQPEVTLVLTGWGDSEPPAREGVRSLGVVSTAELASLYRRASAVVFPSLYEGFGWPVLEAMASGCPVAVGGATAAEEVAGDAAVVFDATSTEEMVDAFVGTLERGSELAALGLERARAFTWERCVAQHEAVYQELDNA